MAPGSPRQRCICTTTHSFPQHGALAHSFNGSGLPSTVVPVHHHSISFLQRCLHTTFPIMVLGHLFSISLTVVHWRCHLGSSTQRWCIATTFSLLLATVFPYTRFPNSAGNLSSTAVPLHHLTWHGAPAPRFRQRHVATTSSLSRPTPRYTGTVL